MPTIEKLTPEKAERLQDQLVGLLQDAVHNGASVGFVIPVSDEIARRYWDDVVKELRHGSRLLFVLQEDDQVVGSVQLGLCMRPNGSHRAEVQKLFVHTKARRRGFARALMAAIEQAAREANRSLLYLDTESDQPAEAMYRRLGWHYVGEIPDFAASPDGRLHGTTIFYKKLAV